MHRKLDHTHYYEQFLKLSMKKGKHLEINNETAETKYIKTSLGVHNRTEINERYEKCYIFL